MRKKPHKTGYFEKAKLFKKKKSFPENILMATLQTQKNVYTNLKHFQKCLLFTFSNNTSVFL